MRFSENWLRELVDMPLDRRALEHRLTMAGHEVEAVSVIGDGLDGVVVAEIIAAEAHPEADRLQLCTVRAGDQKPLTIVCGAANARVGLKTALARIGARLPGGAEIKPVQLRGVESRGMLCSGRELGIDDETSGLLELPADAPSGTPLAEYLGLPDASIELGLTPNRPDCLGMHGLVADVAAIVDCPAKLPAAVAATVDSPARRSIRLDAGADCPRYMGRIIEGIDATAPTPLWIKQRLLRAGLRPISVVVDVTHYVMLELGQPLHAFDNDKLAGEITVRHARAGESLTLLDGSEARFDADFVLIADDSGPLAAAGIMGGQASAVGATTRNVFLESAHFAPAAIMGRARRLARHTDASHRFERGVDPELPQSALERATGLLLALAGGRAGPVLIAERGEDLPRRSAVPLRRKRMARVLGIDIEDAEVERILRALDMRVEDSADGWIATPPSRRFDIEREEDLIEEVARIHGYERIPTRPPDGQLTAPTASEQELPASILAGQLAARGYLEAICMAFVPAALLRDWGIGTDTVVLANPLSTDLAVMRPSLLPGLTAALQYNRSRQHARVRLFEIGHRFHANGSGAPREVQSIALVACGNAQPAQWGVPARVLDFHDLKGDIELLLELGGERGRWQFDVESLPQWLHPGRAARLLRDGEPAGYLGALHPRLAAALDIGDDVYVAEFALASLQQRRLPQAQPVPRQPSIRRDIAIEVDQAVGWGEIQATVRAAMGPELTEIRLFDLYCGPGLQPDRKSLAISLILQDDSRTLVDQDADRCVQKAVAALEHHCGARLRG